MGCSLVRGYLPTGAARTAAFFGAWLPPFGPLRERMVVQRRERDSERCEDTRQKRKNARLSAHFFWSLPPLPLPAALLSLASCTVFRPFCAAAVLTAVLAFMYTNTRSIKHTNTQTHTHTQII